MSSPQSEMFDKPRVHTELPGEGYAARPGSGPAGQTCGSCGNCQKLKKGHTQFNKCGVLKRRPLEQRAGKRNKTLWGWSRATDIRLDAPACLHWKQGEKTNENFSGGDERGAGLRESGDA